MNLPDSSSIWPDSSFEGAEKFRGDLNSKLSFSQRLDVLDSMLELAESLKEISPPNQNNRVDNNSGS